MHDDRLAEITMDSTLRDKTEAHEIYESDLGSTAGAEVGTSAPSDLASHGEQVIGLQHISSNQSNDGTEIPATTTPCTEQASKVANPDAHIISTNAGISTKPHWADDTPLTVIASDTNESIAQEPNQQQIHIALAD